MVQGQNPLFNALLCVSMATTAQEKKDATDIVAAVITPVQPNGPSWQDLNKYFELPLQSDGHPDATDYINACFNIQGNTKIAALPAHERIPLLQLAANSLAAAGFNF